MWKSTLVAQLLTMALDLQGVDPQAAQEAFPEEFSTTSQRSESAGSADVARSFPWRGASADLTDSVRYLVARHLVDVRADGTLVSTRGTNGAAWRVERGSSGFESGTHEPRVLPDEAQGMRLDSPPTPYRLLVPRAIEPFDFEVPRD